MNDADIRASIIEALTSVAPDIEADTIRGAVNFRDQFDFDSMDFLNFVTALHQRFGIDIPEADYPRMLSLDRCVAYVAEKTAAAG